MTPQEVVAENGTITEYRVLLFGAALVVMMIFRPQGIIGDRRELALDAR